VASPHTKRMFGVGARPPEPCAQAQGIQGAGVKGLTFVD